MAKDSFVNTIKGFTDTLHELDKAKLEGLAQKNKVPAADVSWQAEDYQTVIARSKSVLDDIVKEAQKNGQKNILVTSHVRLYHRDLLAIDRSQSPPRACQLLNLYR